MGSLPPQRCFKAASVAILGAGPSGIAAAKYLVAEKSFPRITVYEQRSTVGGLWNYAPCEDTSDEISIPQTSPHAGLQKAIWPKNEMSEDDAIFVSPVYDRLETNIPRGLMAFSDQGWPEDTQLFPKHTQVLSYLRKHAAEVQYLVQFNTQVQNVRQTATGSWNITTQRVFRDSPPEPAVEETFDAVIIANGHYDVPKLPSVPGIEAFAAAYPSVITHSKFYRAPEVYANKKCIIVGNSASGIDIGSQIATVCRLPLLQSQKSESYLKVGESSPSIVEKPEIIEYILDNRSVQFADGSIESCIDAIVYCTGYFYSFPFLDSLDPPVVTTGERVENAYEHIFYAPNPSLAFLALNQKVIPFPWAEAQAAVVARVFSGRLSLPSLSEMKQWEADLVAEKGQGTNFHVLKFPNDAETINRMRNWALSAEGEGGKEPVLWGEEQWWVRERFPSIKKAFNQLGEHRHQAPGLKDVGFGFEGNGKSE